MSSEPPPYLPYPSEPERPGPPPSDPGFRCAGCGGFRYEEGYVEGTGDSFTRWFAGRVEFGLLGGLKRYGRQKRVVIAVRCLACSRLELYGGPVV